MPIPIVDLAAGGTCHRPLKRSAPPRSYLWIFSAWLPPLIKDMHLYWRILSDLSETPLEGRQLLNLNFRAARAAMKKEAEPQA